MAFLMNKIFTLLTLSLFCYTASQAQNPNLNYNKFKQLKEELPTPNAYRTGAGAPGHEYFQQQADYVIEVELDENKNIIKGKETVTYHNNSNDALEYLWLQLDQNVREQGADSKTTASGTIHPSYPKVSLAHIIRQSEYDFDGGFRIIDVQNADGSTLDYTINKTMMRIDLAQPLAPGASFSFKVKYWYPINDRMAIGGRSGYEHFKKDGNNLYTIAQFYPRMAVYNDVEGWQNKQFLGNGEFALPFGNYDVKITVPADHIVGATGLLQNGKKVLTKEQIKRYNRAACNVTDTPVFIVTEAEAREAEKTKSTAKKTWHFKAENVRDFGFATSRKFIWDAMSVPMSDGRLVLAMSLYPKEGNPLWEDYSTRVVAHTLKGYSKYTFDYPYPVAYSVHAAAIGMEYPMICFNFGRPNEDGTYNDRTKYGMLGVIIHEVGHNWFPMIVNSDERQWGWMDEGINTFVEYLVEQEWDENFQHWYGPAENLMGYMSGDKKYMRPIMSNPDNVYDFQLGSNAYGKPATALNILREYIMGRELFDQAFKTYSKRWKFKHPTPADFFRTMEDASAVDLDWFWRAWFFSTDHVDLSLDEVQKVHVKIGPDDGLDKVKNRHVYSMKFTNKGGLPMPVIMDFKYIDGSKERKSIPAEIWKNGDETAKVYILDKELAEVVLDPEKISTDLDVENNVWPKKEADKESKFDKYKKNKSNE